MAVPLTPIQPINAGLPITTGGHLPSRQFIDTINAILVQQQAQINQLQQTQMAVQQVQQQTVTAQQKANAPVTTGASGENTGAAIHVTSAWTQGALVVFGALGAASLTANVTLDKNQAGVLSGGTPYDQWSGSSQCTGEFRIVEVVGGVDTVVYGPAAFTAVQTVQFNGQTYLYCSYDTQALAAFTSARGAMTPSYRLDLRTTSPGTAQLFNLTPYLFVRRA